MDRAARLASICLLLTSAAACGGGPSAGETAEAVQATQAALVRRTPIFFETYPPTAPPTSWMTWVFGGAAVDHAGNTYALRSFHGLSGEAYVHVFDAGGVYKKDIQINLELTVANHLRVNDTGFVIGGYHTVPHFPHPESISQKATFRRFDAAGNFVFQFESTNYNTDVTALELGADGSTVVGVQGFGLYGLNPTGVVRWNLPMWAWKIRCLGDGTTLLASATMDASNAWHPVMTRLASDGSTAWTWTGSDTITADWATFDVDSQGNIFVGTTQSVAGATKIALYALDSGGNLTNSWHSAGTADTFAAIAVTDVVAVTGRRAISSTETHYLTSKMDKAFNLLWTRDDPISAPGRLASARGVGLDSVGNVFVCGALGSSETGALLYGASDGTTLVSDDVAGFVPSFIDVTNGVGRCVGPLAGPGARFALLGFQLQQRAIPLPLVLDPALLRSPIENPLRSPLLDAPFVR